MILYQTEDLQTRVQVRLDGQTAWLSLNELAELFQRDKSVISKHLKKIFEDGELSAAATVANFATVQTEGGRTVARNIGHLSPSQPINSTCPSVPEGMN